jgi:hypothetical protein
LRFAVHGPGSPVASPRSHGVPRRDVPGRVHVSVERVSAGGAGEDGLALARLRIHPPARRTTLARIRGTHLFDSARGLVLQTAYQQAPPGPQDAPVQSRLLADIPPRPFDRSLGAPRHVLDVQVLDADHVEPSCQVGGELLRPVPAPVRLTCLQFRDRRPDLPAAAGAAPGTGKPALQAIHPRRLWSPQTGGVQQFTGRHRSSHCHAAIDPGDAAVTGSGYWVGDRCEGNVPPPGTVAGDPVGLHPGRYGPRPSERHPAHGLREVPQRLLLHDLAAIAQPLVFGSRRGELSGLLQVAGCSIASRAPVLVLLDCQVPDVPGVRAVPEQDRFLFRRWRQPVSSHTNIIANSGRGERRLLSDLKVGVSTPRS